jgi:hypothetical protein
MRGVRKEIIIQLLSGIVAIEGFLQFERVVMYNSIILFPADTAL